jgi:hypothetical protein
MPLADTGFIDQDGRPDHALLVRFGPSIEVVVSTLVDPNQPQPEGHATHALIDTGATQSCIDIQLAESLGLPIVDEITLGGAAGAKRHDVYAARVTIPSLEIAQFGPFAGVDLEGGEQAHRVLLGRTFLQGTVMIYDGLRAQVTIASARLAE